jgi:hypothetical protein
MMSPSEKPQKEAIVEAWLDHIERLLTRHWIWEGPWPKNRTLVVALDGLSATRGVGKNFPVDELDDALRQRGWRISRVVDSFSGALHSPIKADANGLWFYVVPDACEHSYKIPLHQTKVFCVNCGDTNPGPTDFVDDRNR